LRSGQWDIAAAYAIQHAVILTSESYEWPNAGALGARFRGHDKYWFGFHGR
jgi:hypothetical protein